MKKCFMALILSCVIICALSGCLQGTPWLDNTGIDNDDKKNIEIDFNAQSDIKESWRYETVLVDKSKGRVNNIRLSCEAIDGYILKSGGQFSFNDVVGVRSAQRGYEEGIIFIDGDKEEEIGGGICQSATTLYLCAKEADFKIVEVTAHAQPVTYANEDNATVMYGEIDLAIKNNKSFDVKINMYEDGEKVYCQIERIG